MRQRALERVVNGPERPKVGIVLGAGRDDMQVPEVTLPMNNNVSEIGDSISEQPYYRQRE